MDDIFEQMLSNSPWRDGAVTMNRDAWDATAISTTNNTMPPMPLVGGLDGGLQASNPTSSSQQNFEMSQGHAPHHLQQSTWCPPYNVAGAPSAPVIIGPSNLDTFFLQGDLIHDTHLRKRVRDDKDMSLERHSKNMAHVARNQGMQSVQSFGDHQSLGPDFNGAANGAARPRVRARRGQATDPHSIAERNRRERIAERMKALQELVPDSNKTDKASMLDEIIGYVKFLQMQVKCLSMCRLGGAGAAAPLLADLPAEGAGNFLAANLAQAAASGGLCTSQEGMGFAERQVARLMDEDMSAAMQYLQSKGLCLMPISLATAISSSGGRQQAAPSTLKGSEGMEKQALELQAVAAAAAVAATAVGGGGLSIMGSLASNAVGQDGGGRNVGGRCLKDMQRHERAKHK